MTFTFQILCLFVLKSLRRTHGLFSKCCSPMIGELILSKLLLREQNSFHHLHRMGFNTWHFRNHCIIILWTSHTVINIQADGNHSAESISGQKSIMERVKYHKLIILRLKLLHTQLSTLAFRVSKLSGSLIPDTNPLSEAQVFSG